MRSMLDTRSILLAAFAAASFACGGGTSFSSGVDETKQVKDLTDADAKTLCDNAEETAKDFYENNKDGFCKLGGVLVAAFSGGDPATCEATVETCKGQEPETSGKCEPIDTACEATIAEIEACYNDSIEAAEEVFDEISSKSCEELLMDTSSAPGGDVQTPASCTALMEKCPTLEFGNVSITGTSSTT